MNRRHAGDFNCTSAEGLYRFLYRGRLEGGHSEPCRPRDAVVTKTVAHPFLLCDVYRDAARFALPFTYGRPGGNSVIDFVWASAALPPVGVLQALPPARAVRAGISGLPNSKFPSDHLPLGVVLAVGGDAE